MICCCLSLISKFSAPTIAFLAFDWLKNSDYEPIVGVLRHMENSAPSLKISAFQTLCKIVEIKIGGKTRFENLLKQLFHSPLLDIK